MTYFNNHLHTSFSNASLSFSDVLCKVNDVIQYSYDLGLSGVNISDHECTSAYIQALNYYENMTKDRLFKLSLGNEIYLLWQSEYEENKNNNGEIPYYHFILTALDTEGYHQICQLSTNAWERAFMKSIWRRPTTYEDLINIVQSNQGHIISSSACLGSRIDHFLLNDEYSKAVKEVYNLQKIFGKNNFYLEVQPAEYEGTNQSIVNRLLYKLSKDTNCKIICTTDAHRLKKEDFLYHKIFLNAQNGEREDFSFYNMTYIMSPEEIKEYLSIDFTDSQIEQMFDNSNEICERIKGYDIKHNPIIPQIPIEKIPDFKIKHRYKQYYESHPAFKYYSSSERPIHEQYFFYQLEQGLYNKVELKNKNISIYIDRVEIELNELKKISEILGNSMVSYYSTMAKIIDIMWDVESIVGVGRGSSCGYVIVYLLGIIQLDPIPYGDYLPWWRHMCAERKAEIADIDCDSEPCKKYIIIDALKKYFGEDKVLNVATFGVISSKTAIERACKGLGISSDVAGYLKSLIPVNRGKIAKLKDCIYGNEEKDIKPIPELVNEMKKYPDLIEASLIMCDVIINRSLHAAGLCICNEPYTNYLSAMRSPNGTMCTAYNLWDSEEVSLVKFDLLNTNCLTKIHGALDCMLENHAIEWQGSLRATYDKYLSPDVLDYDTPEMWDCIGKMYSVFQWDSNTSVKALNQIKPKSIMELSAGNSLIRLMPEGTDETPTQTYIRYKTNHKDWEKDIGKYNLTQEEKDILWKYLGDAYGLADSQEKVMLLSMDNHVAGYTMKEANDLRKSISKKSEKLQAEAKKQFFEYGRKIGTRKQFLDYIWNKVYSMSFGYS